MKKLINWKLFFLLLSTSIVTSALVMPYALALSPMQIKITPLVFLASIAQSLVLFSLAIFLGLLLSQRIGMGLPIVQGALEGTKQTGNIRALVLLSIGLGVSGGALVILLSLPFPVSLTLLRAEISVAAWKGFLASFYGGIAEEIICRLFLVSLLAWITALIKKKEDGSPTDLGMWSAIVLSAVIFGLGHLGITGELTAIRPDVVIRAILLNGPLGVIYGWLYWKKGLESAMLAHFSTDIILHVITPLVARAL
jgi:hypothetical protein